MALSLGGRGLSAKRIAALAVALAVSLVLLPSALSPTANAVSSTGIANNRFYAYVEPGESLSVAFARTAMSVTVTSQHGAVEFECTLGPCTQTFNVDPSDEAGVWIIDASTSGDNYDGWSVEVSLTGGASIPGRVWNESLNIAANGWGARTFDAYYASEFGAVYRASYVGIRSWAFGLSATNRGVMFNDGSCAPAYRSVPATGTEEADGNITDAADYTTSGSGCADKGFVNYRVFFNEQPAADLPESTELWGDGRTANKWVLPQYVSPTITGLAYNRTAVTSSAGSLTGTLSGQPGVIRVLIDVNNDGDFSDDVDVSFDTPQGLGSFSISWDGLDGEGNAVPPTQDIAIRAELTGEAEIHFIERDGEGRPNGIDVELLNTPSAGQVGLSWNDSFLHAPRTTGTADLIGNNVNSAGGVHGWAWDGNGWGNGRLIDDWTYIYPSANGTLAVPGLELFSIGDVVWFDADQNGLRESDEPLIPGVTVTVIDAGGNPVASTTTGASGQYLIENLVVDQDLRVKFDLSTADVSSLNLPFHVTASSQLVFTAPNVATTGVFSSVDPSTAVAPVGAVSEGVKNTVNAGVLANGKIVVSKTVEGTAPADAKFGFEVSCSDFRSSVTVDTFELVDGAHHEISRPAGSSCVVTEVSNGNATAVAYRLGNGVFQTAAPAVSASPGADQELLVRNSFVAVPGGSLSSTGFEGQASLVISLTMLALGGLLMAARRRA